MITLCVHYIFLLRGCVKNSTCVTENLWYLHFCREIDSALYIYAVRSARRRQEEGQGQERGRGQEEGRGQEGGRGQKG